MYFELNYFEQLRLKLPVLLLLAQALLKET